MPVNLFPDRITMIAIVAVVALHGVRVGFGQENTQAADPNDVRATQLHDDLPGELWISSTAMCLCGTSKNLSDATQQIKQLLTSPA